MAFTLVSDWTPAGPLAPVGAGAVLQDGWIDVVGGLWSITAGNLAVSTYVSNSPPLGLLARPVSEAGFGALLDVVFTFQQTVTTDGPILLVRAFQNGGINGYLVQALPGGIILQQCVAGTLSGVIDYATLTLVPGTSYGVRISVEQTSPTSSTIAAYVYNPSNNQPLTNVIAYADETAALQNQRGVCAICDVIDPSGTPQDGFSQILTYTDAIAATTYEVTGPVSGAPTTQSSDFTVIQTGILSSAVTVTLSDNGAGGVFKNTSGGTITTVTLPIGTDTSAQFTYTPASGVKAANISFTNNGALTDPSPVAYICATWTAVSTTPITGGPTTPGGPGSNVINGWTDELGSSWSINSSNQLVVVPSNTQYNLQTLDRPLWESMVDFKFVTTFFVVNNNPNTTQLLLSGRQYKSNGVFYSYYAEYGPEALVLGSLPAGGRGEAVIFIDAIIPNYSNGDSVTLTFWVVQVSPTTTALALSAFDNTTSTLLGQISWIDSSIEFQNLLGPQKLRQYTEVSYSANPPTELITYTDFGVASTYTVLGPQSGSPMVASAPFYVTASGSLSGSVTITPNDNGGGGTFSPTSMTLTAGAFPRFSSFTYTPASIGVKTLSFTNNAGLTNPSNLTYAVYILETKPVTDAGLVFSPYNWKGDTGRGGSAYRQTWNCGAYCQILLTASAFPHANLLMNTSNPSSSVVVGIYVNGQLTTNILATGSVDLTGLQGFNASAVNDIVLFVVRSGQTQRWNGFVDTLQIDGVQIDSLSSMGVAPTCPPLSTTPTKGYVLFSSDSLGEGINVDNGVQNVLDCWSFLALQVFARAGYHYAINACVRVGWDIAGFGGVPAWYDTSGGTYNPSLSRYTLIDQGVSVLSADGLRSAYGADGTSPYAVIMNLGENDAGNLINVTDMQNSIYQWLIAERIVSPNAYIFVCIPFSIYCTTSQCSFVFEQQYVDAVHAAINAYQAAFPADSKIITIDLGAEMSYTLTGSGSPYLYADDLHYLINGQALVASETIPTFDQLLNSGSGPGRQFIPNYNP